MIVLLLDHIWQSSLIAGVIALSMPLFRRHAAALRYGLWLTASVKFLVPFALLTAAARTLKPVVPITAPPIVTVVQPLAVPFSQIPHNDASASLIAVVSLLWGLGLLTLCGFWLLRWSEVHSALRKAWRTDLAAPVPVSIVPSIVGPMLVGIFRSIILLPAGSAQRLSPPELEAILAHEVCHLRRRDNVTGMVHLLTQSLFWFYPPVWWIGSQLVQERERACDESVLATGVSPLIYAEGILKVCRFYVQSSSVSFPGASGGHLDERMSRIMAGGSVTTLGIDRKLLLLGFATLVIALPVVAALVPTPVRQILRRVEEVRSYSEPTIHQLAQNLRILAPNKVVVRRLVAPKIMISSELTLPAPVELPTANSSDANAGELATPAGSVDTGGAIQTARKLEVVRAIEPTGAGNPDDVTCRLPQQLPGSRLEGPEVCKHNRIWAQLRAMHEDLSADGTYLVPVSRFGIVWRFASTSY